MFGLFNKKGNILPYIDDEGHIYDADDIIVHYEGTLISPEYAAETLVWQNNGKNLRDEFNTQPFPHHMLLPHGKGKMIYKPVQSRNGPPHPPQLQNIKYKI